MDTLLQGIYESLLTGKKNEAIDLVSKALDEQVDAHEILKSGLIRAMEQAGLRDRVKVMVGGAPVTERFAHDIGADGYAPVMQARLLVWQSSWLETKMPHRPGWLRKKEQSL